MDRMVISGLRKLLQSSPTSAVRLDVLPQRASSQYSRSQTQSISHREGGDNSTQWLLDPPRLLLAPTVISGLPTCPTGSAISRLMERISLSYLSQQKKAVPMESSVVPTAISGLLKSLVR